MSESKTLGPGPDMSCARSEELWSDHLEETLAPPLESALQAHLSACAACRDLLAEVREVVGSLKALEVPEPEPSLTKRILLRTRSALLASRPPAAPAPVVRIPARHWMAAAAIVALVLVWRPPELLSSAAQSASRTAREAYSLGVRTALKTERFLEDLNVLRMTVGVAFEDRLDRLNEQLQSLSRTSGRGTGDEETNQSRDRREEPGRKASSRRLS